MAATLRPILLVEDNAHDLELSLEALARCHLANPIDVVRDGAEALEYLHGIGKWLDRPSGDPAVVMLDLKLPKIDGLEVLEHVKSDPVLRHIPVVMLTSSREERDLVLSYELGVNAFVVKPVDFTAFLKAIQDLGMFWGVLNEPPPRAPSERPDVRTSTTHARLLLVEDSDIDAELIGIHLARSGTDFDVLRARNRAEFDAAIATEPIDLILADYSLPDLDGLTALDEAQRRLPDAPVIFVSGVVGEELATDALRRGATDYVVKRNLARLPGSVKRALAERSERRHRRAAEAALVKSEADMRLALDAATLGLWHITADGRIGYDERCGAMLRAAPDPAIEYPSFLALAHADDRAALDDAVQAALHGGAAAFLTHESRFVGPDGKVRWIAIHGRRVGDEQSNLRMAGVMQDVTATRRLESSQRHAELLFRLASQATGLGIWEIGPARDEAWIDDRYRQMVGLVASTQLSFGDLLREVVADEDRAALRAAVDAALDASGTGEIAIEHRVIRPSDGDLRWLAVEGRRVIGLDGRARLVGTVRDVTEPRRLQSLLVESNEELERRVAARTRELTREIGERGRVEDTLRQMQRLEAVGQLTSGVAHDFNNLLMVVISNISLIGKLLRQQQVQDDRIQKRLDSMREAAQRGGTLTRQLLAFSRRQRLEPQSVQFNEIVKDMRDLLQTTLGGSVHLATELQADAWPALVDPTQMELIILNLAINARDAMEVGGTLMVRTSNMTLVSPPTRPEEPEPGEYAVLSVSDTGTGMTPEVLAKAFEPFFTTKEVGKGSGLGLAQVYGFAKQSGGGVRILTTVGQGTTVQVFMPRSPGVDDARPGKADPPDESPAPMPIPDVQARADQPKTTLLIVDDDDSVREATASLLEGHGYRVETARDAGAALERVNSSEPIDLVLADFAMPRMNGAELALAIRRRHPDMPVVFLTGYADVTALARVEGSYLLQKPVAENDLVRVLGEVLGRAVNGLPVNAAP